MSTNDPPSQKRIARKHLSTAWFVGLDDQGASHFWSFVDQAIAVVNGTDADVYHLDETPCDDLGDWREHVATQRGWTDCRVGNADLAGVLA